MKKFLFVFSVIFLELLLILISKVTTGGYINSLPFILPFLLFIRSFTSPWKEDRRLRRERINLRFKARMRELRGEDK